MTELEGETVTKRIEKVTSDEHIDAYTQTIISLLDKDLPPERSDIKKYLLVLVSDLLASEKFLSKLSSLERAQPNSTFSPFFKHIDSTDEIVKLLAIHDLTYLLIQPYADADESIVAELISTLSALTESTSFNLKYLALELITEILSVKKYRAIYWKSHNKYFPILLQNLNSHISHNSTESIQFQYKILLSIWLLSFNTDVLKDLSKYYLSDLLVFLKLVKISIKEKIIRLAISILLNVTSIPAHETLSTENIKFFILTGDILPTLTNLKERKWSDEELVEDLDALFANVQEVYSKLTSFDEYTQELAAKNFKNSPVHTSDEFFLDNLRHFQDNNYKVFKTLISLLDENMEPKSYVYVLSDISKILKLDSKAIEVLTKENKKTKIMELLNHKNSEVRYEALKATQFIVSQTFK